jgi:putative heme iron utilization protein
LWPNHEAEGTRLPDSPAFAARCLLRAARAATLATQEGGQPFVSLVTPAVAPDGAVLMLLSDLSAHTRHLMAEPRCALMAAGAADGLNPQTAPRVTAVGRAMPVPDPALRQFWVSLHPYAAFYADFTDFRLWRLVAESGHYVAGFASAHVLAASDLASPAQAVAALRESANRIIAHCNQDHADALARLAHAQGAAGPWRMLGVDPDGFDLVQDESVLRVAFDRTVADAAEVRAALVRMLQAA